jgi:large subunit ribosomal protein L23
MADLFKSITLQPLMSEKAFNFAERDNRYVFIVPLNVNRHTVASAVESQFSVTVEKVNIVKVKGKKKRTQVRGRRPIAGRNSDFKKAYVLVKVGQTIPIFQTPEEKKPEVKAKGKK